MADNKNVDENRAVDKKRPRRRRRRAKASNRPSREKARSPKVVLMNVADPGEARVAILDGGKIDELYLERSGRSLTGNIYRATVTNVEPSLQRLG